MVATENQLRAVHDVLARGWSLETDIRRARDGRFYVSHNPRSSADGFEADAFCALFRAHPAATIALNIKETGDEAALIAYLAAQSVLHQIFLFDMELVESRAGQTAEILRTLHPSVAIAARVSDRGEPIARALAIDAATIIWLDEFDSAWCTEADVRTLTAAGRTVHAVAPDLHGASLATSRRRWLDFLAWGVHGICTDYPAELERVMRAQRHPVTNVPHRPAGEEVCA